METQLKQIFTRQEIADEIGISKRTLERRVKDLNLRLPRHLLTIEHQYLIYKALKIQLLPSLQMYEQYYINKLYEDKLFEIVTH